MSGTARKTTAAKATRPEQRHVTPGELTMILVSAKRDYERAKERFESVAAVVGSHTLWHHSDGRDLCDHDGEAWPCATVQAFAYVYGVVVPEQWERDTARRSS